MGNSLHIHDASDPDGDELTQLYCDFVPRVGDSIHFTIDQPSSEFEPDQIGDIKGTVSRVEVEIRSLRQSTPLLVSVWLDECIATPVDGSYRQPLVKQPETAEE
jgi:hypothetical protein